jgi:hypothetical protein
MPDKITWDVHGVEDVNATLHALPRAVAKRQVRESLVEALEPAADAMRSKAPRLTGATERSITVGTALARSQKGNRGLGGGRADPETTVVHAGPGTNPQALIQEIGSLKDAPQAYVRPAWDAHAGGLVRRVGDTLGPKVMAAFGRASKKGKLRA